MLSIYLFCCFNPGQNKILGLHVRDIKPTLPRSPLNILNINCSADCLFVQYRETLILAEGPTRQKWPGLCRQNVQV